MQKTAAVQANVASTPPLASSFIRSFSVSRSAERARQITISPIGTFTKNASRHDISVSAPPTTMPTIDPTLTIVPNTTIAVLRAGPFGNVVATSAIAGRPDDGCGHALAVAGPKRAHHRPTRCRTAPRRR